MKFHDSKVYQTETTDLYSVDRLVESVSEEPQFKWKGGKIPVELWAMCLGFFEWVYEEHKSEGLIRLFYNQETKEWLAFAPPQEGSGASVDEDKTSDEWWKMLPPGFQPLGSIHSHANMSAFQSGTDHKDEIGVDGFHATVGKLAETYPDLHFRTVFGNAVYSARLWEWVESPLAGLASNYTVKTLNAVAEETLKFVEAAEFPKEWKENFRPFVSKIITEKKTPSRVLTLPTPSDNTTNSEAGTSTPESASDMLVNAAKVVKMMEDHWLSIEDLWEIYNHFTEDEELSKRIAKSDIAAADCIFDEMRRLGIDMWQLDAILSPG